MNVLLVDDHKLFREGMRYVLEDGLSADLAENEELVIFEAGDSESAVAEVRANPQTDLVLLDLNIPGNTGMSTLAQLIKQFPLVPVVVLSASQNRTEIRTALEQGAMGFIPKDSSSSAVTNAIRLVMSGNVYLPPALLQEFATGVGDPRSQLTERQIDVITLMAKGMSNKEIARNLSLAEATIKMHITHIMRSLEVGNRTQAVLKAERLGLVYVE